MEKKYRILLVHNYYQLPGGEDRVVQLEANMLKEHGHQVFYYLRKNCEINEFSFINKICLAFDTIFSMRTYKEVKQMIKDKKIDIVHVHNTFPLISYAVYYAANKCGVPVVQTLHNFRFLCANGLFYRDNKICELCRTKGYRYAVKFKCYRGSKLESIIAAAMLFIHKNMHTYRKVSAFIALTDFNKSIMCDLIDENKIYVKPNFTDEKFDIVDVKYKEYFFYAGRLEAEKGVWTLVKTFAQMPDNQLLICGQGTEKLGILEFIRENDIKNIIYLGNLDKNHVKSYMKNAIAVMVPSQWYEGFPMVIIEAFSVGRPVIASDVGNVAQVIKMSDAGELFKSESTDDLRTIINDFVSNHDRIQRCSSNAMSAYSNLYCENKNYKTLISIYNDLIN